MSTPLLGQTTEQRQDCDCNEGLSWVVLEDNLGAYEVPCRLPDTLTFHIVDAGIERRYIFLDCKGAIIYQKQSSNGDFLVEGQLIPTDSVVRIYFEPLFEDEENTVSGDTIEYRDAYFARKIGLWIYR